jgi:hypothetical protein
VVVVVLVAVLQLALVVLAVQAAVVRGITTTNPVQAHRSMVKPILVAEAGEEVVTAEGRPRELGEQVVQESLFLN